MELIKKEDFKIKNGKWIEKEVLIREVNEEREERELKLERIVDSLKNWLEVKVEKEKGKLWEKVCIVEKRDEGIRKKEMYLK